MECLSVLTDNYSIAIFGGLFTSVLFLMLIYLLRPSIKVSKIIVLNPKGQYVIKLLNRSLWKVIDVHFELVILRPFHSQGGPSLKMKRINLDANQIWFISQRPTMFRKTHYRTDALHVKIKDNLREVWSGEDAYLEFKIIAKHGLSGFPKIIKQEYFDKDLIREGEFGYGSNLDLKN